MHPAQILYEDNHLLVVDKPADWVVQGAQLGQRSLLEAAKDYLKVKYHKPGKVFLGVVSRLDAPVTGVVPFARTSKAAARLSEQFRDRTSRKLYWGIVEGVVEPQIQTLNHQLVRDPDASTTRLARGSDRESHSAILRYRRIQCYRGMSLLEIELVTGRKHQIRCQMAAMGWPIVGDKLYRAHESIPLGIALHCRQLRVEHPTTKTPLEVTAPLPDYWPVWAKQSESESGLKTDEPE